MSTAPRGAPCRVGGIMLECKLVSRETGIELHFLAVSYARSFTATSPRQLFCVRGRSPPRTTANRKHSSAHGTVRQHRPPAPSGARICTGVPV